MNCDISMGSMWFGLGVMFASIGIGSGYYFCLKGKKIAVREKNRQLELELQIQEKK